MCFEVRLCFAWLVSSVFRFWVFVLCLLGCLVAAGLRCGRDWPQSLFHNWRAGWGGVVVAGVVVVEAIGVRKPSVRFFVVGVGRAGAGGVLMALCCCASCAEV